VEIVKNIQAIQRALATLATKIQKHQALATFVYVSLWIVIW